MSGVAGVVLAAGSGSRMGEPKAGLVVDGVRLVDRAVAALNAGGCAPVAAVVRSGWTVEAASVVVNPDPERGMRSSLALAVEWAASVEASALAVLLADMPGVSAVAVEAMVGAWRPGRIAIATYAGRRAHPSVMPLDLWREALELAGPDEGARALLATRRELVDEIAAAGDPADLDTQADVAHWTAAH